MKYRFFWGGYLSNWHLSPFTIDGIEYNCVEQYMMAMKALTFHDLFVYDEIMLARSPREQKKLGRKVGNFRLEIWNNISYGIVMSGVFAKFAQSDKLIDELLNETCVEFVEASPYDKIWGIGYREEDALQNIDDWGENRLGKIITQVRNDLAHVVALQGE